MKLKLHSIDYLAKRASETFQRFPSVVLIAIVGTLTSIYLVHNEKIHNIYYFINFVLCLIMAVFSTLSIYIFSEKNDILSGNIDKKKQYLLHIPVFIILTFYYFTLPFTEEQYRAITPELMRYAQYNISLVMIVMFIAFINKKKSLGIWNFNYKLAERFSFAGIYSFTLFTGLSAALFSIDKLLEISIPEKSYLDLWIFIVGIFTSIFFLAGIPKDYEKLEEETFYPPYLKFFSQFVLISISLIYMFILYLYGLKIAMAWELPNGRVSALILGCASLGIFSFISLYPLQEKDENAWIKVFTKYFYILLLPLIGMLFIAINRRVSDYGITEPRYFLSIIAFWLFGISIYFIFSKIKDIKYIPISLAFISFFTAIGPWSAYNVSFNSQFSRLERILIKDKILENGKVVNQKSEKNIINTKIEKSNQEKNIENDDLYEISSILSYLNTYNKINEVNKFFDPPLKLTLHYSNPQTIMEAMNLRYVHPIRYFEPSVNSNKQISLHYSIKYQNMNYLDISGYDIFLKNNYYSKNSQEIKAKDKIFKISIDDKFKLTLKENDVVIFEVECNDLFRKIVKKYKSNDYSLDTEDALIEFENKKGKIKIFFTSLSFTKKGSNLTLNNVQSDILMKIN